MTVLQVSRASYACVYTGLNSTELRNMAADRLNDNYTVYTVDSHDLTECVIKQHGDSDTYYAVPVGAALVVSPADGNIVDVCSALELVDKYIGV